MPDDSRFVRLLERLILVQGDPKQALPLSFAGDTAVRRLRSCDVLVCLAHTHTHELHYRYFGVLALGKTLGDAIIIKHPWAAPSKSSTRQTACEPAPRFRVGRPGSRTSRAEHSAHAFSAVLTHFRRTIPAAYVGRTGVPFFSFLSAFPFGTKLFPFRSGADGG